MADHHHLVARAQHARDLDVHLGDQRAGGVEHLEPAALGIGAHLLRHAVRAEDHRVAPAAPRRAPRRTPRPWRAGRRPRTCCARSRGARRSARRAARARARPSRWRARRRRRSRADWRAGLPSRYFRMRMRRRRPLPVRHARRAAVDHRFAQSKYSRRRQVPARRRVRTSRRLQILSASLTSFASANRRRARPAGACARLRRGPDRRSPPHDARDARAERPSISCGVVSVSSTVSCSSAAHSTSTSVTPPSFTSTSASASDD